MQKENFKKAIAKSVLKNSLTATAWIFAAIFEIGEVTVEAFLSPSMYSDFPHNDLFATGSSTAHKKKPKFKEVTIRQSIRRLQKQGFVEKKDLKYVLTAKGRELAGYILNRRKVQGRKWDGKYRVVIFDIPENKRRIRDWLREELYLLDYKKLQESVFIGKYALPDDLVEGIKRYKIGNHVNYLLVDKVYQNII